MRKGGVFLPVATVLSLFSLAACDSAKPPEKTEYATYTDPVMNISVDLPQKGLTNHTLSYSQMDLDGKTGNFVPKDGISLVFQPEKSAVSLFVLQYYDENEWNAWEQESYATDEITDVASLQELGGKNGVVYVYAAPAPDEAGMDGDTEEKYQRVLKMLPTIRRSIALIVREAANTGTFPSISTTSLNDNPVDSKPFEKYQLTMVNFWGTFYSLCVEEMPNLGKLSKEVPEGTRLVGVVTDVSEEQNKQTAQQLISKAGVTYENWIPDDSLIEYMNGHISGVPATLLIGSKGRIVDEAVIDKRDIEKYKERLVSRLSSLSTIAASSAAEQSAGESSATLTSGK